jgi:hypothetical protein
MPYLTVGDDDGIRLVEQDPARDLPRRDPADAPHPLAPVAECDSEHLWCVHEYDVLKWARDPECGLLHVTYDRPMAATR